jgi:flagellar biosynthetic protein FliO
MTSPAFPASRALKFTAIVVGVLVLLLWAAASGQTGVSETTPPADGVEAKREAPDFGDSGPIMPLERIVISLAVVLGGGGLAIWAIRKFGRGRFTRLAMQPDDRMQLVDRLPLGGRRGLVIVRAAGRLLVLGVSEAGIQTVHDHAEKDEDQAAFPAIMDEASGGES